MIIHYYMQFFPGEGAPGSQQPMALTSTLAARGHQVHVISADYNVDNGENEEELERGFGSAGRLMVHRVRNPRGGRGGLGQRLYSYLHFMVRAWRFATTLEKPDVVVGSIQPMFAGLAARRAATRVGCPFLLEVRDLWPDALVVKGAISSLQSRPLHAIVNSLYRSADRIVSLTPGIKRELLQKGIRDESIDVFPNGFDEKLFDRWARGRAEVRAEQGWGNDLVAIYTGSFQDVTAVDVIVRAAHRLRDVKGLRFELFGGGPTRERVAALVDELGLPNLSLHAPVPKREVPGLLGAADVALMALFETPLAHIYFENKFMDYMGAGLPIVAAMRGMQAEIIRDWGVGKVVESQDDAALARVLHEASQDPERFARMGARGAELVRERLALSRILAVYADTIETLGKGGSISRGSWDPVAC